MKMYVEMDNKLKSGKEKNTKDSKDSKESQKTINESNGLGKNARILME